MVVTFYSFKGGVGRSMALANVGEILAGWGYHVVLCDWDLEAPGLERYLVTPPPPSSHSSPSSAPAYDYAHEMFQFLSQPGLMDLLRDYKTTMSRDHEPATTSDAGGPTGDLASRAPEDGFTYEQFGNVWLRKPSSYLVPVAPAGARAGSVRLLTAGRRDDEHLQRYAAAVRGFDWQEFYDKWAGDAFMEFFRRDLGGIAAKGIAGSADIVLIDSRTGVTEQGGVCTHHLADLVVLVSAANDLNIEGARWMAKALSDKRLEEIRGGRPLWLLPVAARIEQTSQKEELVDFRAQFLREFSEFFPKTMTDVGAFALQSEIPYMGFYSFKERVVAREPPDRREQKLYAAYQVLADQIVRCGVQMKLVHDKPAPAPGTIPFVPVLPPTPVAPPKYPVILSYFPSDRDAAQALGQRLTQKDVRIVDVGALPPPGQSAWNREEHVRGALQDARAYLVVVGPGAPAGWIHAEMGFARGRQALQPALRVVPVLLPGTDVSAIASAIGPLRAVTFQGVEPGQDLSQMVLLSLTTPTSPATPESVGNPFPGFRPFTEDDTRIFFGRDTELAEVVESISNQGGRVRWLQVEGANGVGKTSFVRACVVPAFLRGLVRGLPAQWLVYAWRPDADPIAALARTLDGCGGLPAGEIEQRLRSSRHALEELMHTASAGTSGVLLLIDSLEDVLATASGEGRVLFDQLLAHAIESATSGLFLLTTLRADSLASMSAAPRLESLLRERAIRYELKALAPSTVRDSIAAAAAATGLIFESGLLDRIVADARTARGAPALLGPLLSALWDKRSGTVATHKAYDELGGLAGALVDTVQRRFELATADQARRCRALILRLVSWSGARTVSSYEDALTAAGGGPEAREALAYLTQAPPLVIADSEGVRLSHDVLVTHWPQLRTWIDAEQTSLRRRDELELRAHAWAAAGRPANRLPVGAQLQYYAAVSQPDAVATRFLRQAQVRNGKLRTERLLVASLAAALLLTVGLSGYAWITARRAETTARANELAARAMMAAPIDPVRSLALAVAAGTLEDTTSSQEALKLASTASSLRALFRHDGKILTALFQPHGSNVLTVGSEGAVRFWSVTTGAAAGQLNGTTAQYTIAAFTPDGQRVVLGMNDGRVTIWTPASTEPARLLGEATNIAVSAVDVSPDGQLLLVVSDAGNVSVWNLDSGSRLFGLRVGTQTSFGAAGDPNAIPRAPIQGRTPPPRQDVFARFTPDGRYIFTTSAADGAQLWTSQSGGLVATFDRDVQPVGAVGQQGMRVATASLGRVAVWNLNDGKPTMALGFRPLVPIAGLALSPDSRIMALWVTSFGSRGAEASLLDVTAGQTIQTVLELNPRSSILCVAFSSDSARVVGGLENGEAEIWTVKDAHRGMLLNGHTGAIRSVAFSEDGKLVLTASDDNTVRLWDATPPATTFKTFDDLLRFGTSRLPVTLTSAERDAFLKQF